MFRVKKKTNRFRNEISPFQAIKSGCKNLLMTDSFQQFLCDTIPSKTEHLRKRPLLGYGATYYHIMSYTTGMA